MKRLTTDRGRYNSDGKAMSQDHPDRQFDTKKADNIIEEKSRQNRYWYNENLGIDPTGKTGKEFTREYYDKRFGMMLIKRNEKYLAQRKPNKCMTVDDMMKSKRYCLEGMIVYLGNKDDYADRETHLAVIDDFIHAYNERYPNAPIIKAETHCDELGAIHTTLWNTWEAHDKDGDIVFNQTKALEEMGYKNHGKRFDNAKKDFTKDVREMVAEIALSHGIKLNLTPEKEKGGQDLVDYKRDKAKAEYERYVSLTPTQEDIARIEKEMKYKKIGGNVVISKDDLEKLIRGTALQERIEPLMKPLSRVEKDKIYNEIAKDYDEAFKDTNEKYLSADMEQKQKLEYVRTWLKERGLFEQFQEDYAEHMRREQQKVEFDVERFQDRGIELEPEQVEIERTHHRGR